MHTANEHRTLCLIVDIQERLTPVLHQADVFTARCRLLVQGLQALGIPLLVTEQYPKGLGHTLNALKLLLDEHTPVIEKTRFSAALPEVLDEIRRRQAGHIILIGAEAHICMLQTAQDLRREGFAVSVPFECTASRDPANKDNALQQMAAAGVTVSNIESILFTLMQDAKHPAFKTVSKLIQ